MANIIIIIIIIHLVTGCGRRVGEQLASSLYVTGLEAEEVFIHALPVFMQVNRAEIIHQIRADVLQLEG